MIKAWPKYPSDLYDNIYIDNIQKAVVDYVLKCLPNHTTNEIKIKNQKKLIPEAIIINSENNHNKTIPWYFFWSKLLLTPMLYLCLNGNKYNYPIKWGE